MNRNRNDRGGVLKVLLIILGVIVVIVVGSGIYVATHWKGWAASIANAAAQQLVRDSGLPEDQKSSILTEVTQLGNDFKDGKVSTDELRRITKKIADGPLLPLAEVQATRGKYIEPSDMTAKEKAAAVLNVQRFVRGVYEKKIPKEEVDNAIKPVSDLRPNGRSRLKENATRMELDQFVANAKAKADEVKIPQEPFELNIADELKKVIHGG